MAKVQNDCVAQETAKFGISIGDAPVKCVMDAAEKTKADMKTKADAKQKKPEWNENRLCM